MLFKNLYIENATEAMDIRVTDGKFEKIAASLEALPGEEVVDCGGKLALPPSSSLMSTWIPASPPAVPAGT